MQPTPQDDRVDCHDDQNGEPVVQSATPDLTVLDGLGERPPHEHVAVYEQVHAQLQHALSEIDDA